MTVKTLPSELLEHHWCDRGLAVDKDGNLTNPTFKKAAKWSIIGIAFKCGINAAEWFDMVHAVSHKNPWCLVEGIKNNLEVLTVARESERRMGLVKR